MDERTAVDVKELQAALEGRWARITVVGETASTNADLLADAGAPDRSVLVAEHQAAGRGRLHRTWTSPPRAGLTFSVLLRVNTPMATWGWLPLLAGVAVHSALVETAGVEAALKWPNDVLCGPSRLKVAGILAQTSGSAVVLGIGLNVTTTSEELPVDTATSLALCGATSLDRTGLLVEILARLDARAAQWAEVSGDAEACGLARDYRSACTTIGRAVSVTATDGSVVTGRAVAVDPDGRLRLDSDGTEHVVRAGDVQHLHAASHGPKPGPMPIP